MSETNKEINKLKKELEETKQQLSNWLFEVDVLCYAQGLVPEEYYGDEWPERTKAKEAAAKVSAIIRSKSNFSNRVKGGENEEA